MENTRAHFIISGRVQGVCFRIETQRAAMAHGVYGWVRNKRDGRVEGIVEGDKDRVISLIEWCRKGAPMSVVDKVDVKWQEYADEFQNFDIRY